jgi:hypothetical protein
MQYNGVLVVIVTIFIAEVFFVICSLMHKCIGEWVYVELHEEMWRDEFTWAT